MSSNGAATSLGVVSKRLEGRSRFWERESHLSLYFTLLGVGSVPKRELLKLPSLRKRPFVGRRCQRDLGPSDHHNVVE